MKKVEVCLKSFKDGKCHLIRGYGEIIYLEYNDTDISQISQTAIFHASHYAEESRMNWFTVNLWTGLFITGGKSRKKCLETFNVVMPAYSSMLNNPEKAEFFRKNHEELEKLKNDEDKNN